MSIIFFYELKSECDISYAVPLKLETHRSTPMCVCVCVCVRARARERACVRASMHVCMSEYFVYLRYTPCDIRLYSVCRYVCTGVRVYRW